MYKTMYSVQHTGLSPYQGEDDIGVYKGGVLVKSFNTLKNEHAHCEARRLVLQLKVEEYEKIVRWGNEPVYY